MTKKLLKPCVLFFVCLALTAGHNVVGQRLLQEKFNYGTTAGNLTTVSNGVWAAYETAGVEPVRYSPGSLLLPGSSDDGSGKAQFASASGAAGREDIQRPFASQTMSETGTLYGSALVNFATAGNPGNFFQFMGPDNANFSRVFVRISGIGYNLGITKSTFTTSEVSWAPQVLEFGRTYLIVTKYEHVADVNNDIVKLWVLNAATSTEVSAGEGVTNLDNAAVDAATLQFVGIRQTGVTHSGSLDEVMVGNTWAEVMPAATADTTPPAFVSGTPMNGATNVATNTDIVLTFDEFISAGTGNFILARNGGSTTIAATSNQVEFSGSTVTISNLALETNTTYSVQVEPTTVRDAAGNFFVGISGTTWSFTTTSSVTVPGQLFAENFDYPANTELLSLPGWAHNGGNIATRPIKVTESGLSYPNLMGSNVGNAVALTNTGQGVEKSFGTTVTEGSLYTSMLVNFSEVQDGGNHFFYLNPAMGATNYFSRVFARKSSEGKFQLGIAKQSTVVYGTTEYNVGQTYFLVLKYTFVEGSTNDLAQLFVNPEVGGTEPQPVVTASLNNTDPTGLSTFGFRQVQTASSPVLTVDALKIGTTWASVTPRATSASDTTPPMLVSGTPANGATNVATTVDIVLNFNEPVAPGTGNFTLTWNGGSTSVAATADNISFAGQTVTISNVVLQPGTTYSAQVDNTAVRDLAGNFYAGLAADAYTFSTVALPAVSFAGTNMSVTEGEAAATVTLNVSAAAATEQQIRVRVTRGQNVTADDYTLSPAAVDGLLTLTLPANATSVSFTVSVTDDAEVELDESLSFFIEEVSDGLGMGAARTMVFTLVDNDKATVSFTAAAVSRAEDAGAYTVTLSLDKAVPADQTITIEVVNGANVFYGATSDYTTNPAVVDGAITLTVPAGQTTATFEVLPLNDGVDEQTETITFNLGTVSGKLMAGTANTFAYTITSPLSVRGDLAGNFQVSPNPTSGKVALQLPAGLANSGKMSVVVYSLRGEKIMDSTGTEQELNYQLTKSLSSVAPGIYLVRVQASGQTYQARVMKN